MGSGYLMDEFSAPVGFGDIAWNEIPDLPGVYLIYEEDELLYVGMAGRDGKGSLRRRLKDHSTGQPVNMFAQYLFLARVQFLPGQRATHPMQVKTLCQGYIRERCRVAWRVCSTAAEARALEATLKASLKPVLNGEASVANLR